MTPDSDPGRPNLDALSAALTTEIARRRFGLGHVLTYRPFGNAFSRLPANHTYEVAFKLEAAFDMVRLVYANDLTEPFEVTAASVTVANGAASAEDGPASHWTLVTFGPGADSTAPATRLVVPGAQIPGIPVFAYSDWMRLPSAEPPEGDGRPWLVTRTFMAGEGRCVLIAPDDFAAFADPDQNMGRPVHARHQHGDHAGSPTPMDRSHPYGFIAPVAVQYRARAAGLTVMCVGDGITCGSGTRSRHSGWGLRACASLSRPARPVSYVNDGWSGAITRDFLAAARNLLPDVPSAMVFIAPFSLNDRPGDDTAAGLAEAGFALALTLARDAAISGCLPAFITPLPWGGATLAVDRARRDIVARLHHLAGQGVTVADLDAAVSDGAFPARLRADVDRDGLHPNDAGNAAMAEVLKIAIGQRWASIAG